MTEHCLRNEKFEQTSSDLSLFFRRVEHDLVALSGNYVDNLIRAAPRDQREPLERSLRDQFECSPSQDLPSDVLGMEIARDGSTFRAAMSKFIDRLEYLPDDATYDQYASLRASLLWSHTRVLTSPRSNPWLDLFVGRK